jgi:cytochrome c biogenesis protein
MNEEKKFKALGLNKSYESPQSIPQVKEKLHRILRSQGYKIRENSEKGEVYLLAYKRFLGLFGSDIIHLGILLVIMGGFISSAAAYRENLALTLKETKPVPEAGFSLKLDRFETLYHPDGSVKDWTSTLSIIQNDQCVLTQAIEVNHPLSYKGFVFYQSGYGWDWRNPVVEILIERETGNSFSESIRMKVGETILIKHKNIEINALYFVPDFVLTKENKVTSRSLEPNNPALYVKVLEKEEIAFSGWLFLKYPEFTSKSSQIDTSLSIKFKDFKAEKHSVIQIAKDPGAPFIWTGCTLVMLGLFLAFYFTPRELRFMIKKETKLTKIYAGGTLKKAKDTFKKEFDKIIQLFKESK